MKRYLAFCWIGSLALTLSGQIQFSNVADQSGIKQYKTAYTLGNGISFVDFDLDGLDDLTIGTQAGRFIEFYVNKGDHFERLLPLVTHRDEAKQIIWVDFDNDGDQDLFVASYDGLNRLYENQGALNFIDITASAALPLDKEYTFGAIWADYNRDGWLDLYFGNHKDTQTNKYNKLFRNNGNGTFTDVSTQSATSDLNKVPFCSAFLDFNNDNWPDIYTANDKLSLNTLLMNKGNGSFKDVGKACEADLKMNAMCVAVGDYDNDGWQDIYITNTPIGNKLLNNQGNVAPSGTVFFDEKAEEAGVAYYGNGWGANFFDADNDGDLDLYVNGTAKLEEHQNRTSLFYENVGNGQFDIPTVGMAADSSISYVNAIGDFNSDGFPDIAVQNNPPYRHNLWQNQGGSNHWLKVKLTGVLSNRDAIGAKIEAFWDQEYQMRYRHCGIGFMGQNSKTEILGCKDKSIIDSLVVTWPTGHQDRFYQISTNQTLLIKEGSSTNGNINVDPQLSNLVTANYQVLKGAAAIKLSPNPSASIINLELIGAKSGTYQIFNSWGQVLLQKDYAHNQFSASVHELNPGYYVFKAHDISGKIFSQPFLIR